MKIRHRLARTAIFGALMLSVSGAVFAAQLKENSADIQQLVNVPGMAIVINPGGTGCNSGRHEVWEPTQNGCSNIEWVKKTARVVSLNASPPTIVANNIATSTLLATLKDGDGNLVGPGIPTSWGTTRGSLSSTSTVTNSSGQTSVTLRGTAAGVGTVTAAAVDGSARTNVTLTADPSTSRVVTLSPSPTSVPANWTPADLYATVRDAYNNILPAGQAVYWAATLGSLNTNVSYTDVNGLAVATIASGSAGNSTITARTAVSNNATTSINFTASNPTPTILSFTQSGQYANKMIPNQLSFDHGMGGTDLVPIMFGAFWSNQFNWSAINATKYELVDQGGKIIYSGPATSFNPRLLSLKTQTLQVNYVTWTLRAYNGPNMTSTPITMKVYDSYDVGSN